MSTEIKFLTPEHAGEWLRLRIEALEGDPEAFSSSVEEYRAISPEDVTRQLWSEPKAFVVGAFQESSLIGMAGFYSEKGAKSCHKGRVWGVYVTPRARASGLGKKIMRTLLDRVSTIEGLEQVLLSVAATQLPAIWLYRSLGFESFGREPGALRVGNRYIDEDHMLLRMQN